MAQRGRGKDSVLRVATRNIDSERRFEVKELIYPSTYHAMKAGPCLVGVCKHDGECEKCEEYGTIRRYAALAKAAGESETISQPHRGARRNAETTEATDPTHSAVRKG